MKSNKTQILSFRSSKSSSRINNGSCMTFSSILIFLLSKERHPNGNITILSLNHISPFRFAFADVWSCKRGGSSLVSNIYELFSSLYWTTNMPGCLVSCHTILVFKTWEYLPAFSHSLLCFLPFLPSPPSTLLPSLSSPPLHSVPIFISYFIFVILVHFIFIQGIMNPMTLHMKKTYSQSFFLSPWGVKANLCTLSFYSIILLCSLTFFLL